MKTIAYSSPFVPAEWVAAHGLRPMRFRPDPAAAPSAGPLMGVCPYARAFIAEAPLRAGDGAVVLTTTCDQMRRAAEWLALGGDTPLFLMNVPATWQTPASVRLYRDELERMGRFLVRLGGRAPTRERLAEVMEDYDARRQALRGALGTLSARCASETLARFDRGEEVEPIKGAGDAGPDAPREHGIGWHGQPRICLRGDHAGTGAWSPPKRRADDHATRRLEGTPNPYAEPRDIPVALVGGPLMSTDPGVFDLIERAGGRVVLDGTENGTRTLPAPFDRRRLRDDPLLGLVDAYFGAIPDAFRRPDIALYEWLSREPAASGARGVIVWRYVWCDLWAASVARLREATRLPVLDVDLSGDEAGFTRTTNRIQAFLEVLG